MEHRIHSLKTTEISKSCAKRSQTLAYVCVCHLLALISFRHGYSRMWRVSDLYASDVIAGLLCFWTHKRRDFWWYSTRRGFFIVDRWRVLHAVIPFILTSQFKANFCEKCTTWGHWFRSIFIKKKCWKILGKAIQQALKLNFMSVLKYKQTPFKDHRYKLTP